MLRVIINCTNAQVFQQHNTKLYYNNTSGTDYNKVTINEINKIEDGQPENKKLEITPTRNELEKAFKKMAYEKSPGSNGITTEAFNKNLGGEGFELLYRTIVKYWTNPNYTPEEFTTIKLSMIPKTGDLSNPKKMERYNVRQHCSKIDIIDYRISTHTTPPHLLNGQIMRIAIWKGMCRRHLCAEESVATT